MLNNIVSTYKMKRISCKFPKYPYLCTVFFIVLDLRLTKVGARRCSFFYIYRRHSIHSWFISHLESYFRLNSSSKRNIMIQVMHTVADYVHDAKYKMPDRPLPCFYQGFLSKYCICSRPSLENRYAGLLSRDVPSCIYALFYYKDWRTPHTVPRR